MAAISVTYSFTNGATSDGPQVSQNFTDIISGLSDGTKTVTISALSAATVSFTGISTGGNGSSSVPTYTFTSETTLGLYRVAAGNAALTGNSATNVIFSVLNQGVGGTAIEVTGAAGAGDESIYFTETGSAGSSWALGRDDSDSGAFKISQGTALGTNDFLKITTAGVSTFGSTVNLLAQSELRLQDTTGGEYVGLRASGTQATYTVTLPAAAPTANGNALTYDGANYVWVSPSGGAVTSAKSADYVVLTTDNISAVFMTTAGTNRTVTLPAAASSTNRILEVKKVDSGVGLCTVTRAGADTIDGATTFILADQDDFVSMACDGTTWQIISKGIGSRVQSRVKHEVGAGHGATNTKIRRIETVVVNTGNAVTAATSAANGNSYTINQSAIYAIHYTDLAVAVGLTLGISLNSAQLTTVINGITSANRLGVVDTTTNFAGECSVTIRLAAGDVIRPHDDGTADGTSIRVAFHITKVGL